MKFTKTARLQPGHITKALGGLRAKLGGMLLTALLLLMAYGNHAQAQTTLFTENFESATNLSTGAWQLLNFGSPVPAQRNIFLVYNACGSEITGKSMEVFQFNQTTNLVTCGYRSTPITSTYFTGIRSPLISSVGQSNLKLSYQWRGQGELTSFDFGQFMYSTNGTTWTFFGPILNGQTAIQTVSNLALPAALDNTTFFIGWRFVSDFIVANPTGLIVDNISVVSCPPPPPPTFASGTTSICGLGRATATLTPGSTGGTINWYAAPTGGTALLTNSSSVQVDFFTYNTATFYAATVSACGQESATRTPVVFTANPGVTINPFSTPLAVCPGTPVSLSANGLRETLFVNNNAVAIPDNNLAGANSTINVSGFNPAALAANSVVSVRLNINHTFDGDLEVKLVAPNGSSIILVDNRGSSGDNFTNTLLNPTPVGTTATAIGAGAAPFTGYFIPDNAFAGLTGNLNGNWTLNVADQTSLDAGTLLGWEIVLRTDAGLSYNWTSSPGGFSSTSATASDSPTASTTYSVTATDGICSASGSTSVTVFPQPTVSISAGGPTTVCSPNCVALTANAAGGNAPYTYLWSDGSTAATTNACASGTYSVTVTSADGCTATASQAVTVNATPPTPAVSNVNICGPGSATLSGTSVSGTVINWWNAPSGGTLLASGPSYTASYVVSTIVYASALNTSTGCESARVPVTVTVFVVPTVTISASGPTTFCGPGCVTLTANPATANGPFSYLWSNGSTSQSISACASGSYSVTVTSGSGCTASASQSVTVNTFSAGNLVFTETIGNVSNTTAISTHEAANGFDNDPFTMIGSGDIRNTLPSTGYLGATGGANVFLTNNLLAPRTFEISGINTIGFSGLTISYGAFKSTTTSNGTDLVVQVSSDGVTYSTLAQIPMATGTGTAVWSTRNAFGTIPSTANLRIRFTNAGAANTQYRLDDIVLAGFSNQAVALPAGPTSFCAGGSVQIAASLASSYLWSNGATTQNITVSTSGSYTCTLTDGNGCTAVTNAVVVTVFPQPSVTATSSNVLCFGGSTGTANAIATGGTAPYAYLWTPGGQTTASLTGLSAGTYTVNVTDVNGCAGSQVVQFSENMGTVASGTIAIHEAGNLFQNTALTMSGSGDVRTTQTSAGGYAGASGGSNVFLTDAGGAHDFQIAGFNSSAFSSYSVSFGVFKSTTASTGSDLAVEVSADGVTYTPLTYAALPTGTGTAVWTQRTASGFVPSTSNLRIRFRNNATQATQYRIDDVQLIASTGQATVVITQPTLLVSSASSPTFACGYNVTCNGATNGSATVTASGGLPGYNYLWSNGQTTATASGLGAGTYTVTVTDLNFCTSTATVTLTEPAALTSSVSSPTFIGGWNISCNGGNNGAITSTVAGGATCAAYNYLWSNGATTANLSGLTAGTYSVTVTDANGCTTTSTITLSEPPLLENTIIPQVYQGGWNITCNGASDGMVFANASGGTPSYTYLWSNGATTQLVTGLTAGTYSVTVTDVNGCTNVQTITLTEPALMVDSRTVSTFSCGFNVSCNGANNGSIDYNVTGGTAPYAFVWSNGAITEDLSGLTAGTYSVTATDRNGCTTTETVTLTEPALLTGSIAAVTYACGYNVSCNGASNGSATVTTTGGCAPYTYAWSTGGIGGTINGLSAITVAVTITDANGCQAFATKELTEPAQLISSGVAATFACGYNVSCNGASNGSIDLTVSGGASCLAYSYLWSNGATTQDVSGLAAGSYSVTVTDANGCTSTSSFTLTQPAALVTNGVLSSYLCGFNITCFGNQDGSITLTTGGGCQPYTYTWSNGAATQNLSNLAAGSYTVTVTDANGCSTTRSFTLTQPTPMSATAVSPTYAGGYNIACNGGSTGAINVTLLGGATCATRSISISGPVSMTQLATSTTTFTGLPAGAYNIVATDIFGCAATTSITLTEPPLLQVSCPANMTVYYGWPNSACATITPTVTGGTPGYTYHWSNNATTASITVCPTVSTDYTVTVTDANGCTTTCTTRVCVNDVRCGNNLTKVTICHTPPGNSGNPQTLCIAANAVPQHIPGHAGDYLGACGTNLPCGAPLKTGDTQAPSAQAGDAVVLQAFPNPFSTGTTLAFMAPTDMTMSLKVFNLNGQEVATLFDGMADAGHHYDLDWKADGLSNGIYFAKLVSGNGEVKTLKLVLNR